MKAPIINVALIAGCFMQLARTGNGQATGVPPQSRTQTAGTNNGTMIQNNITVTATVKQILKARARKSSRDEQGWLRVLTPANDPTPQDDCGPQVGTLKVILGGGFVAGCAGGTTCTIIKDASPNATTDSLL